MADELDPAELRQARRRLFDLLDAVKSPDAACRFQVELAEEILRAESLRSPMDQGKDRRLALREHLRELRSYGDSLAWVLLHPHVIRQLAENAGKPPWLSNQQHALTLALDSVRLLSEHGLFGIICDLTNVLRIGDLIVLSDPECPAIVEFKTSEVPEHRRRLGRVGRQISRMEGTLKYLRDGHAHVFGEPFIRVVVESRLSAEHDWTVVKDVVSQAIEHGQAWQRVSEFQAIVGVRRDVGRLVPPDFDPSAFRNRRIVLGMHTEPLRERWSTVAPPFVWDLPPDHRFLLMEGDVLLVHLLDPTVFLGWEHKNGRVIEVDMDCECGRSVFRVAVGDKVRVLSHNWAKRVVYGYETVGSVAKQMIEAVAAMPDLDRLADAYEKEAALIASSGRCPRCRQKTCSCCPVCRGSDPWYARELPDL